MPPNSGGGANRCDDLDALDLDELEVFVVVALVGEELLEEGDELGGLVLVGTREVDVLEVEDEAGVVGGPEGLARVCGDGLATDLQE